MLLKRFIYINDEIAHLSDSIVRPLWVLVRGRVQPIKTEDEER